MPNSMSKRLLLVLILCCSCGWLVKPAEEGLLGPEFSCKNAEES
jgi:hypothetical protein